MSYRQTIWIITLALLFAYAIDSKAEVVCDEQFWVTGNWPACAPNSGFGCARKHRVDACRISHPDAVSTVGTGSPRTCVNADGDFAGQAVRHDSNPCTTSEMCLDGTTGQCVPEDYEPPTDCEPPNQINPITGQCEEPLCPEGTSMLTVLGGQNGHTAVHCFEPLPDDCPNGDIVGYYDGIPICRGADDNCISAGGNSGPRPDVNGDQTCFPRDQPPPLDNPNDNPDCASGETKVYDVDTKQFSCEPLDPPDEIPNSNPNDPPDQDDDGIPDGQDDDIDGDGDPNSSDPDRDGDGVPNEDDITPDGGDDPDDDSKVTGGAGCQQAPNCTGDAIQCAILFQTWKARCNDDQDVVEGAGDCDSGFICKGDVIQCTILEIEYLNKCEFESLTEGNVASSPEVMENDPSTLVDDDVDLEADLGDPFADPGASGSCPPDRTISLSTGSYQFSYTPFCQLAEGVRPLVLVSFSLTGFMMVLRAFT